MSFPSVKFRIMKIKKIGFNIFLSQILGFEGNFASFWRRNCPSFEGEIALLPKPYHFHLPSLHALDIAAPVAPEELGNEGRLPNANEYAPEWLLVINNWPVTSVIVVAF